MCLCVCGVGGYSSKHCLYATQRHIVVTRHYKPNSDFSHQLAIWNHKSTEVFEVIFYIKYNYKKYLLMFMPVKCFHMDICSGALKFWAEGTHYAV